MLDAICARYGISPSWYLRNGGDLDRDYIVARTGMAHEQEQLERTKKS